MIREYIEAAMKKAKYEFRTRVRRTSEKLKILKQAGISRKEWERL